MRKYSALLLVCLALTIISCQDSSNYLDEKKEGMYYPEISEKTVEATYNENALYAYRTLYYDGNIYTSFDMVQALQDDEIELEQFVEEEIGIISTNHEIYWAKDSDKLDEVTGNGVLYKLKDYDEKFRVCIYYEISNEKIGVSTYNLLFFECLNDIYLDKGSDLFSERIKLEESVSVNVLLPKSIEYSSLSMEYLEVEEFINAINDGKFIDSTDKRYLELKEDEAYSLVFFDNMNLASPIMLYKEGYVVKKSGGQIDLIVKVDEKACSNIINIIDKNIR